jgi:AbiV family abortive infection protein
MNDLVRTLVSHFGGKNPELPLSLEAAASGLTACYANAEALIDDATVLAQAERLPRAIAITVLALEELAKIPDLSDTAVFAAVRSDQSGWALFWKRWRNHQSKQGRIVNYGRATGLDADIDLFSNPGPYATLLPTDLGRSLDVLKLRSLYVDYWGERFVVPGSAAVDQREILDELYAVARERADSFAQFHASEARSRHFIEAQIEVAASTSQGREANWVWPPQPIRDLAASDPDELRIDLHSQISHRSSSLGLPDYATSYVIVDQLLLDIAPNVVADAMNREVQVLAPRMEAVQYLRTAGVRAIQMFKLLFAQAQRHGIKLDSRFFPPPPKSTAPAQPGQRERSGQS